MNTLSSSERVVTGRDAQASAVLELAQRARMELAILSHAFEAGLYGTQTLVECVKPFCLAHGRARLRVLVNQPALAMRQTHRLIELGRRLPSRISFRQLDEQDHGVVEDIVIADGRSVLHREAPDQIDARLWIEIPLEARLRMKTFEALWKRSVPAREFSELKI